MIDEGLISLIGPDGRVRSVPKYLQKRLMEEGFKVIINPKEEYYSQYDKSSPRYMESEKDTQTVADADFLEVIIL